MLVMIQWQGVTECEVDVGTDRVAGGIVKVMEYNKM